MDHEIRFRELDRRECLALLAQESVGRVVYTHDALPAVLPVRFFLDLDSSVVLRSSTASHLAEAVEGAIVAFQTDRFDEAAGTGWTVTVTGRATQMDESGDPHGQRPRKRQPPGHTDEEVVIRITPGLITGSVLTGPQAGRGAAQAADAPVPTGPAPLRPGA